MKKERSWAPLTPRSHNHTCIMQSLI